MTGDMIGDRGKKITVKVIQNTLLPLYTEHLSLFHVQPFTAVFVMHLWLALVWTRKCSAWKTTLKFHWVHWLPEWVSTNHLAHYVHIIITYLISVSIFTPLSFFHWSPFQRKWHCDLVDLYQLTVHIQYIFYRGKCLLSVEGSNWCLFLDSFGFVIHTLRKWSGS